ncbi:M48 family metallopeptidase [Dactylosporangium sp. NPDC051485]|uniref:M48 family metallopeptidase n=1 Tax=Dactylosporangium sp. NPDC051485 TaxID=3154846 RepID=UPI00341B7937
MPSEWGNPLLDRLAHRLAYFLDARAFARASGGALPRRGPRTGRLLVLALAALVVTLPPVLLLLGLYLIVAGAPIFGPFLVLLAVAGRPRFVRKLPVGVWEVPREAAPTLFAALERVAAAAGAPMPDVVAVEAGVNAWTMRIGRRRVLCLGLPLWAALPAQQRAGLIGHELGHFVNQDVRDGRLVSTALNTLATIIDALGGALLRVFGPLAFVILLPLYLPYTALLVAARRDGQRAEYLADQIAAEAAGTAAVAALVEFLLVTSGLAAALKALHGRPASPADWRTAGQAARRGRDLDQLRQRSLRVEASLRATHPPAGRRAHMVGARGDHPPAVTMSEPEAQRIDAELAPWFDRLRAADAAYA